MSDRELAKAMRLIAECERRSGTAQPKTVEMLEQAAARLDWLRWRSVEEGLPESGLRIEFVLRGVDRSSVRSGYWNDGWWHTHGVAHSVETIAHWRYATPPGAEGGGG